MSLYFLILTTSNAMLTPQFTASIKMSFFKPADPPKTPLAIYRALSSRAGVRVSPLCLGAMSLGDAWTDLLGSCSKSDSFALLDAFYEAGGNFIDTANNYQDEQSESWVGEWMESKGIRDEIVLATKFTTNYKSYASKGTEKNATNYGGNSNKSLHVSVRDSMKKLRTNYIDILYVHWWDYTTSIEKMMQSLDTLVKSRQVLYLGVSDTPAWVVSKANQYARDHGLAQFVVYQGYWSVLLRDFERDIIPMCVSEGMALAPWGSIGRGKFQSKKQIEERKKSGEKLRSMRGDQQTEDEVKMSAALEKVAEELSTEGEEPYSVTAVALAYVLQRTPYVFPIIGGRKISHLQDNIRSLEITLSEEQVKFLEEQVKFDIGFPMTFIGDDPHRSGETQSFLVKNEANIRWVREKKAIEGRKL
jgi:aryl-alcohol dehydrogenase-like predicted oxidoreductase